MSLNIVDIEPKGRPLYFNNIKFFLMKVKIKKKSNLRLLTQINTSINWELYYHKIHKIK